MDIGTARIESARELGRQLADLAQETPFIAEVLLAAFEAVGDGESPDGDRLPPFMYEDPDDGTIRVLC